MVPLSAQASTFGPAETQTPLLMYSEVLHLVLLQFGDEPLERMKGLSLRRRENQHRTLELA